ncbi:MAG: hypothetical protein Ta2B_25610 [Termitinemataceae bacterium]|nr:MAG: hypothetical protein Ta2B_25610 [Termitinemataceae bacterium]
MKHAKMFCILLIGTLFFGGICFAQQKSSASIVVSGNIPGFQSTACYRLQVGAFSKLLNAEEAYNRLDDAGLNPSIEQYKRLLCVFIGDVDARDVPSLINKIRHLGFTEILIKEEAAIRRQPVQKRRQTVKQLDSSKRSLPANQPQKYSYKNNQQRTNNITIDSEDEFYYMYDNWLSRENNETLWSYEPDEIESLEEALLNSDKSDYDVPYRAMTLPPIILSAVILECTKLSRLISTTKWHL